MKKTVDLDNMFKKSKTTTSKSKIPVIDVPTQVKKSVDNYISLKRQIDNLSVQLDLEGSVILQETGKKYSESKGNEASFKISSSKDEMMTISYKNAFSKPEEDDFLVEHERFSEFFKKQRMISIKKTLLENDEETQSTIEFLINKIGLEKFNKIFDLEQQIVAQKDLNTKQFEAPEDLKPYIKQYKAAIKV